MPGRAAIVHPQATGARPRENFVKGYQFDLTGFYQQHIRGPAAGPLKIGSELIPKAQAAAVGAVSGHSVSRSAGSEHPFREMRRPTAAPTCRPNAAVALPSFHTTHESVHAS